MANIEATDRAGERPRLLLVDDDEDIRFIYCRVFEAHHFQVQEAASGASALLSAYANPPDAIVLDVAMPEMSGGDVLRQLREDKRTQTIPVLMLTGCASEEREIEFLKSGADDFVSKASRSEVIVARLNRLLSRQ